MLKSKPSLPDLKHVLRDLEKTLRSSWNQIRPNCTHPLNTAKQKCFLGAYVLWLSDVVVGVVTAQRGLAGHWELGRRRVVSKGHQVVALLKASGCRGMAGFGGLLQVTLLLNLAAHGGVPVVLDSVISPATETPMLKVRGVKSKCFQFRLRWTGRKLLLAFLFKPSALPWPSSSPDLYRRYSQPLTKGREKYKWGNVVYTLFEVISKPEVLKLWDINNFSFTSFPWGEVTEKANNPLRLPWRLPTASL